MQHDRAVPAALMLVVGLLERRLTGRWPSAESWRAPAVEWPGPVAVLRRAFLLLHGRRPR
ncbi:hypothetical protein [Dactylosporangium darangshiense]|uniref:hypothetical protein n=1 Tax=Dactylosporangium darangshiense TaxID=579108 RepID=UPI0031EBEF1E